MQEQSSSAEDADFSTALLNALLREGEAFTARGMTVLSSQTRGSIDEMPRFVLVDCRPLAARLYLVGESGAPHEYYRETGDVLSDGFTALVAQFVTAGMNSLSVAERQSVSRRLEQEGIRLALVIEGESSTVRALALPRGGGLIGSEELFQLVRLGADAS
jgi:hypothetical protein